MHHFQHVHLFSASMTAKAGLHCFRMNNSNAYVSMEPLCKVAFSRAACGRARLLLPSVLQVACRAYLMQRVYWSKGWSAGPTVYTAVQVVMPLAAPLAAASIFPLTKQDTSFAD
jgi:hypothetical protein